MSQSSNPANSSFLERNGCASPSPLIWVASYRGSHLLRVCAYSRVEWLLAVGVDVPREHPAVGKVAVVGDCQDLAASLFLVCLQDLPEIFRPGAASWRICRERLGLARFLGAITIDDHTMQVVARRHLRGPLVANERGELAGVVVFLRRIDRQLPRGAVSLRAGEIHERLGEGAPREVVNDFERRRVSLPRFDHVRPLLAGGIGEELRLSSEQVREKSHVVGVIGHHQEIERARQLRLLSAGRHHFLAAREAVCVLDAEAIAECARVHRHGGMQVGVTEKHARRVSGARDFSWPGRLGG